ncbi:VanW family protein [Bacillus sp. CGMCC 1.16607]|uniref:VanW family protein n=1 Tax=Bacillus sp. CGMCC 1.16607 TaxID=3351842 RepID=UPI0036440DA7
MKRKHLSNLFFILFLCTAYIFAFSQIGTYAYETFTSESNHYEEGTMIGTTNLSGKTKNEAMTILTGEIDKWKNNAHIQFNYREKSVQFNNESFTFNIIESIELAKGGQQNPLLVQISKEELQKAIVLLAPSVTVTEELEAQLNKNAQSLVNERVFHIDQFLVEKAKPEVLSTIELVIDPSSSIEVIKTDIQIPAESTFSFSEFIKKESMVNSPSDFLNQLASGIYQLVLPTNFKIHERHIGSEIPSEESLGYEAKIDDSLGWDLAFYNPNSEDFSIKVSQEGNKLIVQLIGYSFVDQYKVELSNEQTFEPKTIKHFDPLLLPGKSKELSSGINGYYVEVNRKIFSSNGDWISTELIAKDFYAPKHRIELVGLESYESEDLLADDENIDEKSIQENSNGEYVDGSDGDIEENVNETIKK